MKERRRAPRIEANLKLELRMPNQETASLGETLNISRNGIYFRTEYYMSEGTKLPISIHLPAEQGVEAVSVRPEGIVVRCIPEIEDPRVDNYEVACFFMEITKEDQAQLDAFLERRFQSSQN